MLAISRRSGESFYMEIPPSTEPRLVRVQLARLKSDSAVLGIEAPPDINIAREELMSDAKPATHIDVESD